MSRRNRHLVPGAEQALDNFKYEVADELGILDKVKRKGWADMTTREVGMVGGHMVRKMIQAAEKSLTDEEPQEVKQGFDDSEKGQPTSTDPDR